MKGVRLKICGLRDNIEEVASLQPDYAGFIFYPKSPRYVGKDFSMPDLDKSIKKVGVFVNESLEKILELKERYQLDYLQLHGHESPEYCQDLKNAGIGIIKAFQMSEDFDFNQLEAYEPKVDFFLFDTKTKSYGGSGQAFNWDILKNYQLEKQYFLSGGISLENLIDLTSVDLAKVHALDVNSKFELKPGLKDMDKLREFKKRMKNQDSN